MSDEGDQYLETANSDNGSGRMLSPSAFLQNLTAKVNSYQGNGSNSVAEVQRVRSELSNQVQSVSNKQEMQMRQLDSQLAMLQQELKPKLQNIERQQGFTQKQLEEIRQRAQKLQMEELSPLQYKFDQMGIRFDRFMRVELESKLKPFQDDLRQSRAKLDELSLTINTNFRKIDDKVNEMTQKVKNLSMNLNNQKTDYEDQITSIEPRLEALEREITELSDSLSLSTTRNIDGNTDFDADLSAQLRNAQLAVNRLQNETIPSTIQESSNNLTDALQNITQFCDEQLASLESELDAITCSHQVVDQQKQQAEDQLDRLHNISMDVQNKLTSLDQDSKTLLLTLEKTIESNGSELKDLLSDITNQSSNNNGKAMNSISDDIKQLQNSIQSSIRKLREKIRVSSRGNLEAQVKMLGQLSQLKNVLYGKDNALERLKSCEVRIKWVIEAIQEVDNERLAAQKMNGGPKSISLRIASIEERLESAGIRMDKLDPEGAKTKNSKKTLASLKENDENDADMKGKDDESKKSGRENNDKNDDENGNEKTDEKNEKGSGSRKNTSRTPKSTRRNEKNENDADSNNNEKTDDKDDKNPSSKKNSSRTPTSNRRPKKNDDENTNRNEKSRSNTPNKSENDSNEKTNKNPTLENDDDND